MDRRGVDEGSLRTGPDTYFPPTLRTLFVDLHEARDIDRLWSTLLEIYWRPLLAYYEKCAGATAFPRLPGQDPEEVVHEYFLRRVRRTDFREGSIYGKWLSWRLDPSRATSNAIHFRNWIRTDFRNWCRDRFDSLRARNRHERAFHEDEAQQVVDPAGEAAHEREMARAEIEGIVQRAVHLVLAGYDDGKRKVIEAVLAGDREKNAIAEQFGLQAQLVRQWWCRFLGALRPQLAALLRDVGYGTDDEIRGLLEELS